MGQRNRGQQNRGTYVDLGSKEEGNIVRKMPNQSSRQSSKVILLVFNCKYVSANMAYTAYNRGIPFKKFKSLIK